MLDLPGIVDGEDKSSPFVNCIRNNYRHIKKWAKRTETNCFRLYDRQVPHYPLAIDFYAGRFCVHYFASSVESEEPSIELVKQTEDALVKIFAINANAIYWRTRIRTKKTRQYEKIDESKEFFDVIESGVKFKVNLVDYLDTGLFLDHRETRLLIASQAFGKRVLNLFAYTCSFSVHAAVKGAAFTKSVDMSNTYAAWGRQNFLVNSLSATNNEIIRADCLKFLDEEIFSGIKYDIIIIDPPTISRSKKMDQLFDIQMDYISLIRRALRLLQKGGEIYFSTNSRKFFFDESLFSGVDIRNISEKTLPSDFRDPKIHRCWKIS